MLNLRKSGLTKITFAMNKLYFDNIFKSCKVSLLSSLVGFFVLCKSNIYKSADLKFFLTISV